MITFCLLCRRSRLFTARVDSHFFIRNFTKSPILNFTKSPILRDKLKWNESVDNYVKQLVLKSNQYTEKILKTKHLSTKEIKKYSNEVQRLKPIVDLYNDMEDTQNDILEVKTLSDGYDAELKQQITEEIEEYETRISEIQMKLINAVLPRDEDDINNAVLEIRAGVGGKEASLFASEVFAMYTKLSANQRWKFEVVSQNENSDGGVNNAVASIVGKNVFGMLKYESGVHRIQRVPTTDSQGRIHTSTIAVSVLPQPTNVEFALNMKDVKVDTFRSTGAGGQHVNTTDSAVRFTHIPTGIVVESQQERSQLRNRETARQLLSTKIYDLERTRQQKEHNTAKSLHFSNLDRSQRIRTYNFPQDRITDHRVKETLSQVNCFLSAGPSFIELNEKLGMHNKIIALSNIIASNRD